MNIIISFKSSTLHLCTAVISSHKSVIGLHNKKYGVAISKFLLCGRVAPWLRGRLAANKTLPYFDCGNEAARPQRFFCRKLENILIFLNIGVSKIMGVIRGYIRGA